MVNEKNIESKLTLDDVISFKFPEKIQWSPDGKCISFLWDDGGKIDLWAILVDQKKLKRLTDSGKVNSPNWSPNGKSMLYIQEGDIWKVEVAKGNKTRLTKTQESEEIPRWSPDGLSFCYIRSGDVWIHSMTNLGITQLTIPGKVLGIREQSLVWSNDSRKIAFSFIGNNRMKVGVSSAVDGEMLWNSEGIQSELMPIWHPDNRRVIYQRSYRDDLTRQYLISDIETAQEEILLEEKDVKGVSEVMRHEPPKLSPDGSKLMLISLLDGWPHIWLKFIDNGDFTQLTNGESEDIGHLGDLPQWSPDGQEIAFSSNRESINERDIWTVNLGGETKKVTSVPGTNVSPRWSPDSEKIAFIHSGPHESIDIWLANRGDGKTIQLTNSMPKSFTKENITVSKGITFRSAENWDIHGRLFKPAEIMKGVKYPAIVWVHGGPGRQMRYGWHPMKSYSIFHAFHQYLLQKGYIVLYVDYRGSIGYGKEYEQGRYLRVGVNDCLDVVNGAEYLRTLDYVDPEKIGVWGISYGGYMILNALMKHPDVFKMGINIAGIFDFELHQEVRATASPWLEGSASLPLMGGTPEENPEIYYNASPINFVDNLKSPLFNFQGTGDKSVSFDQMDKIVSTLTEKEKYFEVTYYPDESHVPRYRRTWKDLFSRAEKYFDESLTVRTLNQGLNRIPI